MTVNQLMRANHKPIEIRVSHSLTRLGYKNIQVTDLGKGQVKLSGSVASDDDRAIVIAAARSVAGVTFVVNELT